jgi:hypothetical protein
LKRICLLSGLFFLVSSCNQNSSTTESKLDSIGKKFDSVGEKTWDSTKAKASEIRDKVEGSIENGDSLNKK